MNQRIKHELGKERFRFQLPFEVGHQPSDQAELSLYAFDANGTLLAQAPVKESVAEIEIQSAAIPAAQLFVGPQMQNRAPTVAALKRLKAYEPVWHYRQKQVEYQLQPVPTGHLKLWFPHFCRVQGHVVKPTKVGATTVDLPVYNARVHICEVDPLYLVLSRIPDSLIFKLRDSLLYPVVQVPHLPIPEDPLHLFALSPAPAPVQKQLSLRSEIPTSTHLQLSLSSSSPNSLRNALVQHQDLIMAKLCDLQWLWPYFYTSDEIAVVETDSQGRFDQMILYWGSDKPDLYFWVEYCVGGTWATVSRPSVPCHTYWNYHCNTDVTIRITDPRVDVSGPAPSISGMAVAVMLVGNNESVSRIQGAAAGTAQGLTASGSPFGGSLEPRVWFGTALIPNGITQYRWSYRRLDSGDAFAAMDQPVYRQYMVVKPDNSLIVKADLMGPVGQELLTRIQPPNAPEGGVWVAAMNSRLNSATAYFNSPSMAGGNVALGAGKYEWLLELFTSGGIRVDLTAAGIALHVPDPSIAAPFGPGVIPFVTVSAENLMLDPATSHVIGYRLVVHVDNNPCVAGVDPVALNGMPAGACGFLEYDAGTESTPNLDLRFTAGHPHDFATLSFSVRRGSGPLVEGAAGPVGAASIATASVLSGVGGVYTRTPGSHHFSKTVAAAAILGSCTKAAFAESLYVAALATDGYGTLTYLDRSDTVAFALAPATM